MRKYRRTSLGILLLPFLVTAVLHSQVIKKEHAEKWKKFTENYCVNCHGAEKQKGKFRLDRLSLNVISNENYKAFNSIYSQIQTGEMPPENKKQPAADEKTYIGKLLNYYLRRSMASGKLQKPKVALKRMTRNQYRNTLSDLMKVDLSRIDPLKGFSDDRNNGHSFDVVYTDLRVSPNLIKYYLEVAEKMISLAQYEGKQPAVKKLSFPANKKHMQFWGGSLIYPKGKHTHVDMVLGKLGNDQNSMHLKSGHTVPHRGQYKLSITAESLFRTHHTPPKKGRLSGYDKNKQHILAVQVLSAGHWKTIDRHALPDNKKSTFHYSLWLEKAGKFRFVFENGPTHNADALRKILGIEKGKLHEKKTPRIRLHEVALDGPFFKTWPPQSHQQLYGNKDIKISLRNFARRAFRRPVADSELQPFFKLAAAKGIDMAYKAVLCSPWFIYHCEDEGSLDNYSLANRLSYGLTNSMPDKQLASLASKGGLSDMKNYVSEVKRLMKAPGFKKFTKDFVTQWLHLHNIDKMQPDEKKFRSFYGFGVKDAILEEPVSMFNYLISNNLPVSSLIDADFTLMNDVLAGYYGIKGCDNTDFKKVKLPANVKGRGGLLGMASVLTASANGADTSPVTRGVYVLEYILGQRPPDPPEDVDGNLPDLNGTKTIRELFSKHRSNESCNQCHKDIDPIGFALENFNAAGIWRGHYPGKGKKLTIDAAGQLPNGKKFKDIDGLKELLINDVDAVTESLVRELLVYLTGRPMTAVDQAEIIRICQYVKKRQYKMADMLMIILSSHIFKNK